MFGFHGWAVVRYHTHDTDMAEQDRTWSAVVEHVATLESDLVRTQRYNGCDTVLVSGQHNHRGEYVIELFEWIGNHASGSYGLLYILDDEDTNRGADFSNEFRVWRLRRGSLTEVSDPFLSPCVPAIEDAHDPSRDD